MGYRIVYPSGPGRGKRGTVLFACLLGLCVLAICRHGTAVFRGYAACFQLLDQMAARLRGGDTIGEAAAVFWQDLKAYVPIP